MAYYVIGAIAVILITGSISRRIRRRGKTIMVTDDNCVGCGKCLRKCRRNVFEMIKDEKSNYVVVKNPENCTACGDCLSACRFGAIKIVELQERGVSRKSHLGASEKHLST